MDKAKSDKPHSLMEEFLKVRFTTTDELIENYCQRKIITRTCLQNGDEDPRIKEAKRDLIYLMKKQGIQQYENKEPNFLDELRGLVREGVPIFAKDPAQMKNDIISSMYYSVKAQLPNDSIVFLHGGKSAFDLTWLVDQDSFSLGDSIRYIVDTKYTRGTEKNGYITQMTTQTVNFLPRKLSRKDVQERWDLMKGIIPQEEYTELGEHFDIHEWYSMISHGMKCSEHY